MNVVKKCVGAAVLILAASSAYGHEAVTDTAWSAKEIAVLRSLWIGSLPALPPDPSNVVGDDPRAAELGHRLFFDTRLSSDGQVACATCHMPELAFTDGRKVGLGVGSGGRNTMTVLGTAYSPWFFWDGRADSQWAQALGPPENAVEHGGTRSQFAHLIAGDATYRAAYEELFGALPDLSDGDRFPPAAGPVDDPELRSAWEGMAPSDRDAVTRIYANIGKAIAAYERLLLPGPSRFDRYVEAVLQNDFERAQDLFTPDEEAGLRLFIGKGQCLRCHNGPLFTNNAFHNTSLPDPPERAPDRGRLVGVQQVVTDVFNCLGPYSDAASDDCAELRFVKTSDPHFDRGFKTPTLRSVSETGPYMHDGRLTTLWAVLDHYNRAPRQSAAPTELNPLNLSRPELAKLEAFLGTLDSPPRIPDRWLGPPR